MEKSVLQIAAEAARFDGGADYRKESAPAVYDPAAMPRSVPASSRSSRSSELPPGTEVDWAGNPIVRSQKKYMGAPAVALKNTEHGILGEEEKRAEKTHFAERDVRFKSVDPAGVGAPMGAATYQLGPGGRHTASTWKTNAQSLFDGDEDREARINRGAKRPVRPSFEVGADPAAVALADARRRHEGFAGGMNVYGSAGPAPVRRTSGRAPAGSLLAGIGAKIAIPDMGRRSRPSSGSEASGGGKLPPGYTGKLRSVTSDRENHIKTLMVENHHAAPPGYTGKRRL